MSTRQERLQERMEQSSSFLRKNFRRHVRSLLIIGLVVVSVLVIITVGYYSYSLVPVSERSTSNIPSKATDILDHGNGWVSFTLQDSRYLYHRSSSFYEGYEAITVIPNGGK